MNIIYDFPVIDEKQNTHKWTQKDLRQIWELFGDIPINDADEILEPFMDWPVGTNRFDIWHWFDERYTGGVYALLHEEG